MALPVFKSSANNTPTASSLTASVVCPSAALAPVAGELLLLVSAAATGSGTTITFPAGFTELTPVPTSAGNSSHVAWKISDGTEGGTTITITASAASKRPLILAIYSGVSATPIAAQSSAVQTAASLNHPSPALTTAAVDQLEVAIGADATGAGATQTTTWTFPTLTKRATSITSVAAGASSLSIADSAATPNASGANLGARADTADVVAIGTSWTLLLAPSVAALTASLAVSPASGTVPFTVTATATATGGTGTVKNYAFVWGDGATTVAQVAASATHQYVSSGTYTVTATVTNT